MTKKWNDNASMAFDVIQHLWHMQPHLYTRYREKNPWSWWHLKVIGADIKLNPSNN